MALDATAERKRPLNHLQKEQNEFGIQVRVGTERFACPEALFRPEVLRNGQALLHNDHPVVDGGLAEWIVQACDKCDPTARSLLHANVMLCGGNLRFPGVVDRLELEMHSLLGTSPQVRLARTGSHGNWMGGSILGSCVNFESFCVSKQEYEELGPSVVHVRRY